MTEAYTIALGESNFLLVMTGYLKAQLMPVAGINRTQRKVTP